MFMGDMKVLGNTRDCLLYGFLADKARATDI
jgi:hypothetical protein